MKSGYKALLGATAAILLAGSLPAAVLYSNGGPTGSGDAIGIDDGQWVADSFTLDADATVTEIDFSIVTLPGNAVASVEWGISSTLDFAHATTSVTSGSTVGSTWFGWEIQTYSFSVADLPLTAGTYYLTLASPVSSGGWIYWDIGTGSSAAYMPWSPPGDLTPSENSSSNAFQVVGHTQEITPTPAVPEPASWALMLGGFGLVGAALRGARRVRLQRAG